VHASRVGVPRKCNNPNICNPFPMN
jgi:hypothetical protein